MASKLQIVTEFSQKKTLELASVRGNWQRYLRTAARIYKYPFRDQLLIHVQRPDATACATIEFWNSRMDRWVNRGTVFRKRRLRLAGSWTIPSTPRR